MRDKTTFIFGVIFSVVGLGVLTGGLLFIFQGLSSTKWPSTGGIIVESRGLYENGNPEGKLTGVRIEYSYSVEGREYSSSRISFHTEESGTVKRQYLNNYKEGQPVVIQYSPSNPSKAVILSGVSRSNVLLPVIGLVFLSVGVGIMLWAGRKDIEVQREIDLLNQARRAAAEAAAAEPSSSFKKDFMYPLKFCNNKIGVSFMIVMGLFVIGFSGVVTFLFREDKEFLKILTASSFFYLIGIVLILTAINIFISKVIISFSEGSVDYEMRRILCRKHFHEPLRNYVFIVPRRIVEYGVFKGKSSPATAYRVVAADFIHRKNPKKDFRLRLGFRDYKEFDVEDADYDKIESFASMVSIPVRKI